MENLTKENAIRIWKKYNTDDALLKHAIAVGAAMSYFSKKYGGNEQEWEAVGILHDIDYGQFPKEHCIKVKELLEKEEIEDYIIRAIQSHGYGLCTDIKPETDMERVLFTVDELTGFIVACALVRPSKSLDDLEYKSVKKKWKDKAFASGVDRSVIENGCQMLNMELEALVKDAILALKPFAKELGLNTL